MPAFVRDLKTVPRLLMDAPLRPLQGSRFQPTGFPDLGAAVYQTDRGQELLVESAQSMANRLELVCWDEARKEVIEPLAGISFVRVERDGEFLTSSILEAHRINSPYILESKDRSFFETLQQETNALAESAVDFGLLARILCKYDCNCLLHGVFLAKKELAGGRLRVPRALSAFIEATDVHRATSGGVKRDDINPTKEDEQAQQAAEPADDEDTDGNENTGESKDERTRAQKGFANVPYPRTEYTAGDIRAYFNLDLAQIRAYALGEAAEELLVTLALFKVARFLETGLRLRTACDLEPAGEVRVTRPEGWALPSAEALEAALPDLVATAAAEGLFADPPVTTVQFTR